MKLKNLKKDTTIKVKEFISKQYNLEEIREEFSEMINLPKYVIKIFLLPVLFFLTITIIWIYTFREENNFFLIITVIIFIFLSIVNGILRGGIRFPFKIKENIEKIIELTIDTTEKIKNDSKIFTDKKLLITNKDIAEGVIDVIIFPVLTEMILKRMFLVGSLIGLVLKKIVKIIVLSFYSENKKVKTEMDVYEENENNYNDKELIEINEVNDLRKEREKDIKKKILEKVFKKENINLTSIIKKAIIPLKLLYIFTLTVTFVLGVIFSSFFYII